MTDYFWFKAIFGVLIAFGFELLGLLQGIKYYKTGELIVGTRFQDVFWREDKTADHLQAILASFIGILFFVLFNIPAFLINFIFGLKITSIHILVLFIILRWYWKKKTIEANQIKGANIK
ncbi:MAG: hypothetical protein GYA51_10510 [Candidatus Methanofastidiosa archaeon]|nr:hypothetical protein [Candidatus Methanofastidiosa archaeon]